MSALGLPPPETLAVAAGFSGRALVEHWVEFGQGSKSVAPAPRELEAAILERELAHGDHPVL
jgi:hypothetical protein